MKIILIAGTFNDEGGKPSGYAKRLADSLQEIMPQFGRPVVYNGGTWDRLKALSEDLMGIYDAIIWMADVPNDKPKLIEDIKRRNPFSMLVTSKRNDGAKYSFMHMTARALQLKANLFMEFRKDEDGLVKAWLYDPLGNSYLRGVKDIYVLAGELYSRLEYLSEMDRVSSFKVGPEPRPRQYAMAPDELRLFVSVVKDYAETFHSLIHDANTTRLLGNCSFRCAQGGFPSARVDDIVYVSRRNMDKRDIGLNAFVPVKAITLRDVVNSRIEVEYYGDHKPSVDTPIQLALYAMYPNIRFMLHSHVYVKNAPVTVQMVPCGALQEITEILDVVPSSDVTEFAINLKGHGSLVASNRAMGLEGINYIPRIFPESA